SVLATAEHVITHGYPCDSLADLVHHAGSVIPEVTRIAQRLAPGKGTRDDLPVDRVHAGSPHSDADLTRSRVRLGSVSPAKHLRTPVFGELERSHPTVLSE